MLAFPRQQPIIEGLNSFYLDIHKLFEHFQKELGTCGIHMKAPIGEGIIYFDSGQFLGASYQTKDRATTGREAIDMLVLAIEKYNFVVSVYRVDPDKIFFWANVPSAIPLYRDLTTDLTDLDRLIVKMLNEQSMGCIEVVVGKGPESGVLLFDSGKIVAASISSGEVNEPVEVVRKRLTEKTKAKGGTFHVSQIPPQKEKKANSLSESGSNPQPAKSSPPPSQTEVPKAFSPIPLLEELLTQCESICSGSKRVKDFQTQLRAVMMELADTYTFLDPFVHEFEYSGGKVRLKGIVDPKSLVCGVLECVRRMLTRLGLMEAFHEKVENWYRSNADSLKALGVKMSV